MLLSVAALKAWAILPKGPYGSGHFYLIGVTCHLLSEFQGFITAINKTNDF
jgi:hypothetical protein